MERELIANGLLDKRWSDNFPSECQRGPRTLEAVSFAILMADAFCCPTTDGVDDVGRAFNGTEAVT